MEFSPQLLERAHYWMRFTRAFDDRLSALFKQGKLVGGLFSQIGHEAISVGAALALDDDDVIAPLHRDVGAYFVRGMTPARVMSQYLGRETGPSRGRDVNMHGCGDLSLNIVGFISHLPQTLPVAVGIAHAFKLKREPRVAMNFFGDGASSEGLVHEAMNWASVFRVPMIFIVENNRYAYSTPTARQMRVENIVDRAAGYGMPGVVVDGNDFFEVHETTVQVVEHARKGEGPVLIECKTMRMRGHAIHDNMSYVPKELLAEWEQRDPIARLELRLREMGLLDDAKQTELMARVVRDLDAAQAFAENAPFPDPAQLTQGIYAV
ncbi:MAG: thiamine pyrophosphate-dependent dehydrogenase E1 component subunit alpha [Anaerolineae bacterium]|nr:thiamine pyrophosphate-dependent dehydrogenase E1 component subunit alpha [Anaerolineae bacterium]